MSIFSERTEMFRTISPLAELAEKADAESFTQKIEQLVNPSSRFFAAPKTQNSVSSGSTATTVNFKS